MNNRYKIVNEFLFSYFYTKTKDYNNITVYIQI